jgi:hypothetical protein
MPLHKLTTDCGTWTLQCQATYSVGESKMLIICAALHSNHPINGDQCHGRSLRSPNPLCHISWTGHPTLSDNTTWLCVVMPKPATALLVRCHVLLRHTLAGLASHTLQSISSWLTSHPSKLWQVAEKMQQCLHRRYVEC